MELGCYSSSRVFFYAIKKEQPQLSQIAKTVLIIISERNVTVKTLV